MRFIERLYKIEFFTNRMDAVKDICCFLVHVHHAMKQILRLSKVKEKKKTPEKKPEASINYLFIILAASN